MTDERTRIWETLFRHALDILDTLPTEDGQPQRWTFGGGTVLMLKHQHRFSKDIDIFVPDPQYLGYLTPRLNDVAQSKTQDYAEDTVFVKLYFPEGEIDFVAAGALTATPYQEEVLLGRSVRVETATEIIGKKLRFRCHEFKARDLFDVAVVADRDPTALHELAPLFAEVSPIILKRLQDHDRRLREDFAAIDVLDYRPTFDDCKAKFGSLAAGVR
jgi:predicted nucleotidyltransferase component of viral defense system